MDLTLESQSLWYKYKTAVWLSDSEQTAVVHNVMRILRAIRNSGRLAYLSVPITSGKFLYDLKLSQPWLDKEKQLKMAIGHNYKAGWDFVEKLKTRLDCAILYPADLMPVHQKWEQVHFQALWLSIIAEKCTELHMVKGWEYSNGGSEEFVHAWQLKLGLPRHKNLIFFNTKEKESQERERMRNIRIYDHNGSRLTIEAGMAALEQAILWLSRNKFEPKTLKNSLELLSWTNGMIRTGFYQ